MSIGLSLLLAAALATAPAAAPEPARVELEVTGVIPLEKLDAHAIVLSTKDGKVVIPLVVDEGTAVAAAFRIAHKSAPLPLPQDLSALLVRRLGAQVTEVWIDGVQQTERQGRIQLQQGERHFSLSSLPSEAVLLALSQGARIYTSRRVVSDSGIREEDLARARHDRDKNAHPAPAEEPSESGVGGSGPPDDDQAKAKHYSL